MLNSYKELIVWQKSFKLVKNIYKITENFPKSEIYGLTSQMRRSSVSIPSNIAEGFVRKHRKEFSQFISIAFGSGAELETQLELAYRIGYLEEKDFHQFTSELSIIGKKLNTLIGRLRDRATS